MRAGLPVPWEMLGYPVPPEEEIENGPQETKKEDPWHDSMSWKTSCMLTRN
jgi:hypothetical protein